jgi:hypothetical protein
LHPLATVRLYFILQVAVFDCCPFTSTFIRSVDVWIQGILPSVSPLTCCSTLHQRSNCIPILATVRLYRIFQLAVFVFCPFSGTSIRLVDARIEGTIPSVTTLAEATLSFNLF